MVNHSFIFSADFLYWKNVLDNLEAIARSTYMFIAHEAYSLMLVQC